MQVWSHRRWLALREVIGVGKEHRYSEDQVTLVLVLLVVVVVVVLLLLLLLLLPLYYSHSWIYVFQKSVCGR